MFSGILHKISVLAVMNFNYSYRAFLITSLLSGSLVLAMYSITLSRVKVVEEKEYELEYMANEELTEEEQELEPPKEMAKVETNKAYNEAEKYISKLENDNSEITETTEGKLQEMNEAIENSNSNTTGIGITPDKKPKKQEKTSNGSNQNNSTTVANSGNRNTTISYQLVNRKALELPNPVYTCTGSGKVVISIEVNTLGRVIKTSYSKSSSTTANECLIDSAIEYSQQARFTTAGDKPTQLGTITFNFPGQN